MEVVFSSGMVGQWLQQRLFRKLYCIVFALLSEISCTAPKDDEFHKHRLNKICVGSTHGKVKLLLEKKQALTIWREDKPQMAINICKSYINKGSVCRIC